MTIGPFLRRELATSVRGGRAFADRRMGAILAGLILSGLLWLWDYQGWDRASVAGSSRFGLAAAGAMVGGLVLLALGVVVHHSALAIAAERDRKTLDALLASRFSSLEIVLGAMASGLIRFGNALAATVPVFVLVAMLFGVPPGLLALAALGLGSMTALIAGLAVASSVGARTASRAMTWASGLFGLWLAIPPVYLLLRPLAWPWTPAWTTRVAFGLIETSPVVLMMRLVGLMPRLSGPAEAVARMAACQLAATLALVAWSTLRLRPASRALYDVEGERGRIRRLKAALRRPPRRPACSDSPVYWLETHAGRRTGLLRRVIDRACGLAFLGALGVEAWSFAAPAFAELLQRGYGPSPEAFILPELHPFVRQLIGWKVPNLATGPAPGQARLEFNIVLRMASAAATLGFVASAFATSFEAMRRERRAETWLGLLATPLSACEILRGKANGALWNTRALVLTLAALWSLGLACGAVHPLGYLASIALLAASGPFFANLGLAFALMECDREVRGRSSFSPAALPALMAESFLLTAGPLALGWAAPLTYEDVAAATWGGPFPQLIGPLAGFVDARLVLLGWLVGTATLAFGAFRLGRFNERWFDEAVGRPVSRSDP